MKAVIILLVIIFSSCDKPYGEVIKYFEKEGNPEKLEAAKFLINNLRYQRYFEGKEYNEIMKTYSEIGQLPVSERADALNIRNQFQSFTLKNESEILTSEFLIKHITSCYDIWNKTPWKKEYDFNFFCEHVLPYSSGHEPVSFWIQDYHKVWSKYLEEIFFYGGDIYKAVNYKKKSHKILLLNDFDVSDLVKITKSTEPLIIDDIYSSETKLVYLKLLYTCGKKSPVLHLLINNKDTITIKLSPTETKYSYPARPFTTTIHLNKGINRLEFIPPADTVYIDNVEIINREKFYRNDYHYTLTDGASYKIRNYNTNQYMEVHNNSEDDFAPIVLNKGIDSKNQKFNIQNIDYGFFKLLPGHIKDMGKVVEVLNYSRKENDSIVQCFFHGDGNQQWALIPVSKDTYKILNRFNGKCLQASQSGTVTQGTYESLDEQHWIFEKMNDTIFLDSISHVPQNSAVEYALRIFNSIDFEWFLPSTFLPDLPADTLHKYKTGLCTHESQYFLFILRSLGIPASIDFNPQRPNASAGHSWNSIIDDKGKTIMSQINVGPGKNVVELPIAKVYRKTFSINENSLFLIKEKSETIPTLFSTPYITDVTDHYCSTLDINIPLFDSIDQKKRPYLAVFDNQNWFPVDWGYKNKAQAIFKNMGLDVLYLPVYYSQAGIEPAGYPFIIYNDSSVKSMTPSFRETQKLVLYRKYPFRPLNQWALTRMDGSRFEGANKPDFSDAVELYKHEGISNPVFHTVKSESSRKFKYVRYIGTDESFSTISEIMFYDKNGLEVEGKVIGSEGSYKDLGNVKEKAFDKDILTAFDGHTSSGSWIGLEFPEPKEIDMIRFIPRNDGNCIEIGHRYELVFWNNKGWKSLGEQIATNDSLIYHNCPTNALFLLKNHTRGQEERIFTYENEEQVWW